MLRLDGVEKRCDRAATRCPYRGRGDAIRSSHLDTGDGRSHMVASVGRITAGRGYDYLTRDVATSKHDYYTGKGEAPGVWTGRGAGGIGLAGEVAADDMAVLYGRFVVPSTAGGTRLPTGRWAPEQVLGRKVVAKTRDEGSIAEPIAAFDVTFSPSKSVSLLWGLTGDGKVRRVVEEA